MAFQVTQENAYFKCDFQKFSWGRSSIPPSPRGSVGGGYPLPHSPSLAASRLKSALFIVCTLPFLNPGWSTDSRFIMLYKDLKGAASTVYLRMTLSPQLGMTEITTLWHFKPSLLILTFTSAASSPRLLEIGIHLQILSFLLLKEQKILSLSSLHF